jgi:hypothetical protein
MRSAERVAMPIGACAEGLRPGVARPAAQVAGTSADDADGPADGLRRRR